MTSSVLPNTMQNQQHPFLFQPQRHHQYTSSDDVDSPPSLTNSSESPRSASEEGDSALPHFDSYNQSHSNGTGQNLSGGGIKGEQHRAVKSATRESGMESSGGADGEDSIMSPIQAVSPSWESVFASGTEGDEMDMAGSMGEVDAKPWRGSTGQEGRGGGALIDSSTGEATRDEIKAALSKGAGPEMWSNDGYPNSLQGWPTGSGDNRVSDEAMFDSLIQEDSFEQANNSILDASSTSGGGENDNNGLLINTAPGSIPAPTQSRASASALTPPQSAQPSTSALSSRRNSNEQDSRQRVIKVPHCGSHYSHTSDADLPTSSQVVVRPPRSELSGLQVHVHGISFTGAKSRVETQIRTRIELVRPVSNDAKDSNPVFERVGSFNHVKLPPLTGTKRKSKKHKTNDIAAERTLFMDATVVRATPPHDRVLVCSSCQQRERKRAQRKRTGSKKSDQKASEEDGFSLEELNEYGIDPNAADAQEQAQNRASLEDEKRIVVFNCGDFINFEDGACVLPTRITCYCRHHKEKTGFCLIFTMRDYRGNLIATGSTPPIMITDDHKSVAAAQIAAGPGAMTPLSSSAKRVEEVRSRDASTEALDESTLRSINRDSVKKKRSHRAKPYGDADERALRRGAMQSSSSMTPYASTGQNTPAVGQSPSSDLGHPDFWNAFAAMSTMATSPPMSSQASAAGQTPHDVTSPTNQSSPAPRSGSTTNGHDWLASLGNQGSLSSQTLQLSPQSLPGFDLNAFTRSLQQSGSQAGEEASMQQLLMLARSLPGMGSTGLANQQMESNPESAPVPTISKLIPGEGPTSGGIEVTVLGENFTDNLTCLFGDVAATSTKVWGSNTLLCILPPSASPGPVAVSIKGSSHGEDHSPPGQDRYGRSLQLFTYTDTTDRALMELALQVVGLQMTGQMQTARDVAMRVVGSGSNQGLSRGNESSPHSGQQHQGQMRSAVAGLFARSMGNQSFQDSVLQFLTTLDEDVGAGRRDAIRLANKQGHTLLHLTVMLGFHRLAQDLVRRGCPIDARDHNGYTALHFAALHGRMTVARLLLNHGAKVDVECESGRFAIDVAREREQVDVEVLLDEFMGGGGESVDEESDWTTDGEEVDADNISTQVDESVDASYSVDEEQEEGDEGQGADEKAPITAVSNAIDEKASLKAAEEGAEREKKSAEAKYGLMGLVSGGMDLAYKLQLPNAAMGKIGMPTVLHDRLSLMHMPTVSVFQMVLPPTFMNWTGSMDSNADKGKERERETDGKEGPGSTAEDSSRAMTAWRHIFEESAMWINPLYSPPPTYESSLQPMGESTRADGQSGRVQSRFPAIAQPSPDTPHKDVDQANEARRRKATTGRRGMEGRSATWQAGPSTPSQPLRSSTKSVSSSSLATRSGSKALPAPRRLKEDRMLVYFWLPALIFVILLLCFAKPSSVLSYKDLVSFMPI